MDIEDRAWKYSNTGTKLHYFKDGAALCRSSIRRFASDAGVDYSEARDGHVLCGRCDDRFNAEVEAAENTGAAAVCCEHASMYHGARGCDECKCTAARTGPQQDTGLRVLDLYCGVGGAGAGYGEHAEVVGVDLHAQPDYPHEFIRADVTRIEPNFLAKFDMVHASPPCQRDAAITKGTNQRLRHTYPDLIGPTRALLEASGKPYAIENPAARPDVVLCGEMFGLRVIRHRKFELGGWSVEQPAEPKHRGKVIGVRHGKRIVEPEGYYYAVYGNGGYKGTVSQWQDAMGIHWTDNRKSIAEAIPPAYTRWIGEQFKEWKEQHGR